MPELRERVISIICEEWPNGEHALDRATISERLKSAGAEAPEGAVRQLLFQLSDRHRPRALFAQPRGGRMLGSCARPWAPSYLASLCDAAGFSHPQSLYRRRRGRRKTAYGEDRDPRDGGADPKGARGPQPRRAAARPHRDAAAALLLAARQALLPPPLRGGKPKHRPRFREGCRGPGLLLRPGPCPYSRRS